jgi:DNA-binding transcriptional MerR regulator
VTRLRVIRAAARLGFTLAEIADLLEVGVHRHGARHRRPGDGDLPAHIEEKLTEVRSRIDDLRVVEASLVAALTAGCRDLDECAGSPECPIPFPALASR